MSLITRDDTLLGICQGLGEEFGVDPLWLRLGLGALIVPSPLATITAYLAAGLVLAAARWLMPGRAADPASAASPA